MIALAWTTVALIAIGVIFAVYLIGFVIFGAIWRSMRKDMNQFRGRW